MTPQQLSRKTKSHLSNNCSMRVTSPDLLHMDLCTTIGVIMYRRLRKFYSRPNKAPFQSRCPGSNNLSRPAGCKKGYFEVFAAKRRKSTARVKYFGGWHELQILWFDRL